MCVTGWGGNYAGEGGGVVGVSQPLSLTVRVCAGVGSNLWWLRR